MNLVKLIANFRTIVRIRKMNNIRRSAFIELIVKASSVKGLLDSMDRGVDHSLGGTWTKIIVLLLLMLIPFIGEGQSLFNAKTTVKDTTIFYSENGNPVGYFVTQKHVINGFVVSTRLTGMKIEVDKNLLSLMNEYFQECYNDSILLNSFDNWITCSNDKNRLESLIPSMQYDSVYIKDMGGEWSGTSGNYSFNTITGEARETRDYHTERYQLRVITNWYDHKEPTFKGFYEWLKKKQ